MDALWLSRRDNEHALWLESRGSALDQPISVGGVHGPCVLEACWVAKLFPRLG